MMSSKNDGKKVNNKGFSLVELVVSVAICVLVAGAIGILLQGSLGNFDYNQTTIGMQIESQQYAQRIGNALQTTGYAVYTCPATGTGVNSSDADDLYIYSLDQKNGVVSGSIPGVEEPTIVLCDVYKVQDTGATYSSNGHSGKLYTINHYTRSISKSVFDSGTATASDWTGTTSSEPLAGGIASVHYKVYDENGTYYDSGAYTASGSALLKAPKKVTVEVQFLSKNRKLKLDDSSFYFRNGNLKITNLIPD